MAVDKTIKIKLDTSDAITDLKKVRGEIDITYAELRKTTPIELDSSKAKNVLKNLDTDINQTAKSAENIGKGADKSIPDFEKLSESVESVGESALESIPDVKKLGNAASDIEKGAKKGEGGFKKLTLSTKAFGMALKAAGIGLIIAAFVKLQEALGKNQKVMDQVNIALETISITFQQVIKVVVEKGEKLFNFFKKIGKVVKNFVTQDLDGLTSSYEEQGEQVETLIQKNRRLAKELVNLRNEVKLAEAEQRLLQMTYQKEAEIQRQIRDDISLTIDERIAANEELGRILDKQFEDEKRVAQMKIELAQKELDKNKDNIDLQVALTNAKTEMADLDERITGQRSEQLINLTALQQEQTDAIKEAEDAQREYNKYLEEQRQKQIKQNEEYHNKVANRNISGREKEKQEIRDHYDELQKLSVKDYLSGNQTATQQIEETLALKEELREKLAEIDDNWDLKEGERKKTLYDLTNEELEAEYNLRADAALKAFDALTRIANLELENEKRHLQEQLDEGLISQKEFDKQTRKIEKQALKREKRNAMLQILIDTARGISAAIQAGAGLVFPANLGAIASGVATVLAGIASAKATLSQVPGDGGGGGDDSVDLGGGDQSVDEQIPTGSISGLLPNMNNDNSNQPPIQAYVVENEISDAQALQEELEIQSTL